MSDVGTFIVTWTAVTSQTNGIATNSIVVGREFTWDSTGANPMVITTTNNGQTTTSNTEFQISVGTAGFIGDPQHLDHLAAGAFMASNAAVTMNRSGQFIVAWEAFQDNDVVNPNTDVPDSYGIYYRQYNSDGTPKTQVDEQANQVVTALDTQTFYSLAQLALYSGNQIRPSVSMDLDGNFTITWDGNGSDTTTPGTPQNVATASESGRHRRVGGAPSVRQRWAIRPRRPSRGSIKPAPACNNSPASP